MWACHGDHSGRKGGCPSSLAKDPGTEKSSLLLQSSPHHHLTAQTLSGENCAPQTPRYHRRVGRGQEWGETLRRFSSGGRPESMEGRRRKGLGAGIQPRTYIQILVLPCATSRFPICEMERLPLHPGGMGHF